jgi:hypothetical protein
MSGTASAQRQAYTSDKTVRSVENGRRLLKGGRLGKTSKSPKLRQDDADAGCTSLPMHAMAADVGRWTPVTASRHSEVIYLAYGGADAEGSSAAGQSVFRVRQRPSRGSQQGTDLQRQRLETPPVAIGERSSTSGVRVGPPEVGSTRDARATSLAFTPPNNQPSNNQPSNKE